MATNIYLETSQPAVEFAGQLLTKKNIVAKGGVDFSAATSVALPSTVTTTGALALTAAAASNYVPLTITQNDTTNNPNAMTITNTTTGKGLLITQSGSAQPFAIADSGGQRVNMVSTVNGVNGSNPVLWVERNSSGDTVGAALFTTNGPGVTLIAASQASSNAAPPSFATQGTNTITGAVTDGYQAAIRLIPTYSAATAQTVTRHNYIDVNNVALAGVGPAALTDAAVFRFNAAAGTHSAVDAGTTKTSPGAVTQWIKINVNGTLAYIPSYSSKTS